MNFSTIPSWIMQITFYKVIKMSDNFQLNSLEIVEGKPLKVNVSVPNTRLFVGNIPKSKTREDIANEFDKLAGNTLVLCQY